MSENGGGGRSGIGVVGLLGVAFVVMKLTGIIGWRWIWVLGPFWMGLAFAIAIILGVIFVLRK